MWALFIMSLAVASADVILDGPCPNFKGVSNFDTKAYQGAWYQITKLTIGNEAHGECGIGEYTVVGDVLKVNHSHIVDGVRKTLWGVLSRADESNGSGKLWLSTVAGDNVRIFPYWVVSTDYKNYSIVFSCVYHKKSDVHTVHLWVLSRTKILSEGASTIVNNFLKDHAREFPENRFVENDVSNEACSYRKTSAYTIPVGI
uniref:Biliverdin binding protein-II n=1 Tax=Samia ricini TaxID=63990 RepID=Q8T119_SAMRI|nr:biliverdin binding protein-II [Samia ricini]